MLEALAFMHTLGKGGICHRDIKPANFLLRLDGQSISRCVITDFGFACDESSCIHTGSPGTVAYMSPEMIKEKPYGQPADVWAMAVCMAEKSLSSSWSLSHRCLYLSISCIADFAA